MKNAEAIGISRRRFAIGGLSAGAALLAPGTLFGEDAQPVSSKADSAELPAIEPGTNTSFASLKQIDAGLSMLDTQKTAPPMVLPSFFCTAGPTTFTATSMLLRCWPRRAIG